MWIPWSAKGLRPPSGTEFVEGAPSAAPEGTNPGLLKSCVARDPGAQHET
jgi:hypothetical protein